jgi:DNA-binding NarL/FixJ family response regulator
MINVFIVDDQEIVREGLKMILSLHKEIEIVGEACNGEDLLNQLTSVTAEVILMDIRMPVMDGIEATRLVKEKYPHIKIIILTTFDEDEYIFDVLKNGADGYTLKDSGSSQIIGSIKMAYEGNVLLNQKIAAKVVNALGSLNDLKESSNKVYEENLLSTLTQREKEVAEHVLLGKNNRTISEDMYVTEGTVKNYVSRILEKLQLNSRTELILYLQKRLAGDR